MVLKYMDDIVDKYMHIYYPYNHSWLKCILNWDENCRCLDKYQLNVGILILLNSNVGSIKFMPSDSKYYPVQIYSEQDNVNNVVFECEYYNELPLIKHQRRKQTYDEDWNKDTAERYLRRIYSDPDQANAFYVSLCLLHLNISDAEARKNILRYYFVYSYSAFLKYIRWLTSEASNGRVLSEDSITLIIDVLDCFAYKRKSLVIGNVFGSIQKDFFMKNFYMTSDMYTNFITLLKKMIANSELRTIHKFQFYSTGKKSKTIVADLTDLVLAINKQGYNNNFKEKFYKIYLYLITIRNIQKQNNNVTVENDLRELEKILKK